MKPGTPDAFGCWAMVKAEENEPGQLLAALKAGQFYATQGPKITELRRIGTTLVLRCSPATEVFADGPMAKATHVTGTALLPDRFADERCRIVFRDAMGRPA